MAAVLVAIAIPVFTTQLERSREATDVANVRSAYAGVVTDWLTNASATAVNVPAQQKVSGWQTSPAPYLEAMNNASMSSITFGAVVDDNYTISIDTAGSVTISPAGA